jgi:hypothetical protein
MFYLFGNTFNAIIMDFWNSELSIFIPRFWLLKYEIISSVGMLPVKSSVAMGQPPNPLIAPSNLLHPA